MFRVEPRVGVLAYAFGSGAFLREVIWTWVSREGGHVRAFLSSINGG